MVPKLIGFARCSIISVGVRLAALIGRVIRSCARVAWCALARKWVVEISRDLAGHYSCGPFWQSQTDRKAVRNGAPAWLALDSINFADDSATRRDGNATTTQFTECHIDQKLHRSSNQTGRLTTDNRLFTSFVVSTLGWFASRSLKCESFLFYFVFSSFLFPPYLPLFLFRSRIPKFQLRV